jgi:hypothetical protein
VTRRVADARNDNQRHSNRYAGVDAGLLQNVDEVAVGHEHIGHACKNDAQDDESQQCAHVAQAEAKNLEPFILRRHG